MFNGDRLKLLREEKQLTQEELAVIFNVTDATINRYEKNQRQPDTGMLDRFADFFDVSTDYLLGRTEIRNFNKNDLIVAVNRKALSQKIEEDVKKKLRDKIMKVLEE